jgi:predicted membrane protein
MENINDTLESKENRKAEKRKGRVLGGLVVVTVGTVLLAHKAGAELPEWLFTWPMIVVAAGIYQGARHNFSNFRWLIPVAIGLLFLTERFVEGFSIGNFMWPLIIIAIGLSIMLKPSRKHYCR